MTKHTTNASSSGADSELIPQASAPGVGEETKKKNRGFDWDWTIEQQEWIDKAAVEYGGVDDEDKEGWRKSKTNELLRTWPDLKNAGEAKQVSLPYSIYCKKTN